jgi:hypothetical protein
MHELVLVKFEWEWVPPSGDVLEDLAFTSYLC